VHCVRKFTTQLVMNLDSLRYS